MPGLDPAIPLSGQTPQFVNPLQLAMQASQMQATRAETQQRQFALQEAQQKALEDDQFREAMRTSVGLTGQAYIDHFKVHAPDHVGAMQKIQSEFEEKAAAAKKANADAESAHAEAQVRQQAVVSHAANVIKNSGYNPDVTNVVLNEIVQQFPEWKGHADQVRQAALTGGKSALQALVDPLIGADVQKSQAEAANADAERPGKVAASTIAQQRAAGMVNGLTPEEQQQAKDRAANTRIAAEHLALDKQKAADDAASTPTLTEDGKNVAALNYKRTGQLPAMGMGAKAAAVRADIINRASDPTLQAKVDAATVDIASNRAGFHADQGSLTNITKTLDSVSAFEGTAGKNLDMFLDLAKKVPDTGVPWINSPIRALNARVAGNANQAAFNAARDVALREIARVTNDPKLSGALSDHARAEVQALAPASATFAQIKAVAQTLRQDMANVHRSLSDQRDAIAARIKAGTPPADQVSVKSGFRVIGEVK